MLQLCSVFRIMSAYYPEDVVYSFVLVMLLVNIKYLNIAIVVQANKIVNCSIG